MNNKLFIIGNGLDLAHGLPTRFDPDFKVIAEGIEPKMFWDLYQSRKADIWSDFENLLAHPDFNKLEEIFTGYEPDYFSDRESERDGIILQVYNNGKLKDALYRFAESAEKSLGMINRNIFLEKILDIEGIYISFNYTHTLEYVYNIPTEKVLHIHGEVGKNNLELGYVDGDFLPEKYSYDIRQKGRGPYVELKIEDYINGIDDYYIRTAYEELVNKCKSLYKEIRVDLLERFIDQWSCDFKEIVVYGHSCAIDFDYFKCINNKYPHADWTFYVRGDEQERNAGCLIKNNRIKRANIVYLY